MAHYDSEYSEKDVREYFLPTEINFKNRLEKENAEILESVNMVTNEIVRVTLKGKIRENEHRIFECDKKIKKLNKLLNEFTSGKRSSADLWDIHNT